MERMETGPIGPNITNIYHFLAVKVISADPSLMKNAQTMCVCRWMRSNEHEQELFLHLLPPTLMFPVDVRLNQL